MATGLYTIQPTSSPTPTAAATPTFTPVPGAYTDTQMVTLQDTTPGASIFYTLDGVTSPTTSSTQFANPIQVSANTTIKAIASASGFTNSAVATGTYAIGAPSGAEPALVQHVSASNSRNNSFSSPFCYRYQLPNPTTAGNAVVVGFTFRNNPTPTVADDKSDSYAIEVNHFDSANSQSIAIAAAFNVAAGARAIKVCFSSDPGGFVQPMATEFANVPAIDGSGAGAHGTGTSVSAGSLTPSASGDLVYQVAYSLSTNQSSFTAGSQSSIAWNLLSADLLDGFAAQYGVYNSATAISPTIGMGTSQKWVSAAVLLKSGATGGVPSGMRIVRLMHENVPSNSGAGGSRPFANPLHIEFPSSGNLLVAMVGGGNPPNQISTLTDSNGNNWISAPNTTHSTNDPGVQAFYAANAKSSGNLALTANWTNSGGDQTFFLYDVVGASTSPFDVGTGGTGTQTRAGNLTVFSLTPASAGELIFVQTVWRFNTGAGLAGSGQLFDANFFDGESHSGPEPVDENNGWGHVFSTSTSPVTFTWIPQFSNLAFDEWAGNAVAFKAGP